MDTFVEASRPVRISMKRQRRILYVRSKLLKNRFKKEGYLPETS